MGALFDAYKEDFENMLNDFYEAEGVNPFPWVVQVPLKDKVYMTNIEFVDYVENRESHLIKLIIVEENQATAEVIEHVREEEVHDSDFVSYMKELVETWKHNGFYTSEDSNFELDIYDWAENEDNKKKSDEVFEFVIKKCKEAEKIFLNEESRVAYLKNYDATEEEDDDF